VPPGPRRRRGRPRRAGGADAAAAAGRFHETNPRNAPMKPNPLQWQRHAASELSNATLADAWNRLNAERGDLPFLSAGAVVNALDVFGNGSEKLLVGRRGDRICAMFVLVPAGALRWRTFQPSQVPLGCWVAEAAEDLAALSRSLMRGPLGFCLVLSITQ